VTDPAGPAAGLHAVVDGVLGIGTPYHVGLATRRIEDAMEQLGVSFGCGWTDIREGAEPGLATPSGPVGWSTRVAHSLPGPLRFELLEGTPGSVWDTDAVAVLHHVAFWSEEFGRDVELLQRAGWAIEVTFYDDDRRPYSFAYLRKGDAPRVELVDAVRRPDYLERVGGA
jgi:hypothetical protein